MKKIWAFLKNLFRNMRRIAAQFVEPSVKVVELLKKAVESPGADIATAIIPGTWDDWLVKKLRAQLPRVLQILRISDECLKLEHGDEIITCAIRKLREYDDAGRAAQYHSIAALLAQSLADGKLTWREAVHLAEEVFQQSKQPL